MNTNKLILEKCEAQTIYRSLVEMNNLPCPSFTIVLKRKEDDMVGHKDEGIVFSWQDYVGTPNEDICEIVIYSSPITAYGVSTTYRTDARIERHDTQAAFAEAYGL